MQRASGKCCSTCHFHRGKSLGDIIGLSRITLRYSTRSQELGFSHHYNMKLVETLPFVMLIYLLIHLVPLISFVRRWDSISFLSFDAVRIELVKACIMLGGVVQAMSHIIVCKCPTISGMVSTSNHERAMIFLIVYSELSLLGRYQWAKIFGHTDPSVLYTSKELMLSQYDSYLVIMLMAVLVMSHSLPLRWCALIVVEITVPTIYGASCFLWNEEAAAVRSSVFLFFLLLVFLICLGKRQSEVNERLVFSSLLEEKTLRMKAEYALSQADQKSPADDAVSTPETTCTGEAFAGLDVLSAPAPNLNMLLTVGKREQWLIDERELTVHANSWLGAGGFGMVLAGEFHASPVALKIHQKLGTDKKLLDIGNELRLLRKLRHPNIVLLHGACLNLDHRDLVLVMEKIIGEAMPTFISRQPAVFERCQILLGICHGLMYLHSRGPAITHGDMKPSNVMIEQRNSAPHAKILDFGLARLITRNARPGGGTYRWLAPEVLSGDGHISVLADVFALGLIVFFTSTGLKPFEECSERFLKSRAKGKSNLHIAVSWPVESSEFANRCKPIVNLATQQSPKERPFAYEICRMITEFEECKSACHLVFLDRADGNIWQHLSEARRVLSSTKQALQLSAQEHWLAKCKFVDQVSSQHLKPVREQELPQDTRSNAGLCSSNPTLIYPTLPATPNIFMKASVTSLLLSWNCRLPVNACCEFHASLEVLFNLREHMQSSQCKQLKPLGGSVHQCASCFLLSPAEELIAGDLFCGMCGFRGPPQERLIQDGSFSNDDHHRPIISL